MEQTERIAETHEYNIQPTANRKKNIQKNKANCYIFSAALIKLVIAKSFDCFLIILFCDSLSKLFAFPRVIIRWIYQFHIIFVAFNMSRWELSFYSTLLLCMFVLGWIHIPDNRILNEFLSSFIVDDWWWWR